MIEVVLEGPDDVNAALFQLDLGRSVTVIAGEQNRRPKSWLIHGMVESAADRGSFVRRPQWVTRGFFQRQCHMKSCVFVPNAQPPDLGGVREPRRPLSPRPCLSRRLLPPRP